MTNATNDWRAREQELRNRVLGHVKQKLTDSAVHTAGDAFHDLLANAHDEMVEDLLRPIFDWSDYWPKRLAAEMLNLPADEEFGWEELLDHFEAQEHRESVGKPERTDEAKEGF